MRVSRVPLRREALSGRASGPTHPEPDVKSGARPRYDEPRLERIRQALIDGGDEILITNRRALARWMHVSEGAIRKAELDGRISGPSLDGTYDLRATVRQWVSNSRVRMLHPNVWALYQRLFPRADRGA